MDWDGHAPGWGCSGTGMLRCPIAHPRGRYRRSPPRSDSLQGQRGDLQPVPPRFHPAAAAAPLRSPRRCRRPGCLRAGRLPRAAAAAAPGLPAWPAGPVPPPHGTARLLSVHPAQPGSVQRQPRSVTCLGCAGVMPLLRHRSSSTAPVQPQYDASTSLTQPQHGSSASLSQPQCSSSAALVQIQYSPSMAPV